MVENIDPTDRIDITIVDAMFLLHMLLNVRRSAHACVLS